VEHILSRRLRREPLHYILQSACFYGREFHVDARVLIPRPETELLVEHVLARAPDLPCAVAPRVLDVGTGSGAIAVTLACELKGVQVVAIDRSAAALQVARANAAKHMVSDRVLFVQADLISAIGMQVDAITANLPYIPTADIPGLSAEVSSFEPRAALDGGASGLDLIRVLCLQAPIVLKPDGWLFLEVGQHQAAEVAGLLSNVPIWAATEVLRDLRGIDRIVVARMRRRTAQ
jgi:release factor glutamine methyltransferase